jgi:hypothetical protein
VFSIEDSIWDDQKASVSDAVVRMLGQSLAAFRRVCTRGREFWDDLKAPALQRHFWLRNEPYALTDPRSPLKSQQMRPPSERTKGNKLLMRKIFSRFLTPTLLLTASASFSVIFPV